MSSDFYSFETSAKIIQRDGWKICDPTITSIASLDDAKNFIEVSPARNKLKNFAESRFRLLLLRLPDRTHIRRDDYRQLLETAEQKGWIHGGYADIVANKATLSAIFSESGNLSFVIQTQLDESHFISLAITQLGGGKGQYAPDWTCFFIGSSKDKLQDLRDLLDRELFPHDFAPLEPDMMFLPVSILKQQMELHNQSIKDLLAEVFETEVAILGEDPKELRETRNKLFRLEERHREQESRWLSEQDLADNLLKCFTEILKRRNIDSNKTTYSRILQQRVETQQTLLRMLRHHLTKISSKITSHHHKVDAVLNTIIAQGTLEAAEGARRDSASMKTIAALTLLFLPGTFIASVFSMPMFEWHADDGESVVSSRLWLYFLIAVPLTIIVVLVWIVWYRSTQRKYPQTDQSDHGAVGFWMKIFWGRKKLF